MKGRACALLMGIHEARPPLRSLNCMAEIDGRKGQGAGRLSNPATCTWFLDLRRHPAAQLIRPYKPATSGSLLPGGAGQYGDGVRELSINAVSFRAIAGSADARFLRSPGSCSRS